MIEFRGKLIPTTMEELVAPKHSALIVIDVQNDLCLKGAYGGMIEKQRLDISTYEDTIKNIRSVLEAARKAKVMIIYTQHTALPNSVSVSAAQMRWRMKMHRVSDPKLIPEICVEGSWGQRVIDEIKPLPGDIIVKKNRPSAFMGTNLDIILRNNDIRTIVTAGVVTWGCVLSTVRNGDARDYFVVVLEDCVNSHRKDLDDAELKIMNYRFDVVSSSEIIKLWSSGEN